jgi:hypothetical protein
MTYYSRLLIITTVSLLSLTFPNTFLVRPQATRNLKNQGIVITNTRPDSVDDRVCKWNRGLEVIGDGSIAQCYVADFRQSVERLQNTPLHRIVDHRVCKWKSGVGDGGCLTGSQCCVENFIETVDGKKVNM